MADLMCPCCGGQKATRINDHEYRCEYCGNIFTPAGPSRPAPVRQQNNAFLGNNFNSTDANGKNRTTAALLSFLLGGIGAHQFYLGNTGKGILYLVLCWTYIPAIIGVIEGILLISQTDEEFALKPKLLIQ